MSALPDDIDENIRPLVEVLNSYPGVMTIGSCGGHTEPISGGSWAAGTWYVLVTFSQNLIGWRSLEFLAWAINSDAHKGENPSNAWLIAQSYPPWLNTPGETLRFSFECRGDDHGGDLPVKWANWLREILDELYVPVEPKRKRLFRQNPS